MANKEVKEVKDVKDIFKHVKAMDVTSSGGSNAYHSLENLKVLKEAMISKDWKIKKFEVKELLKVIGYKRSYIDEKLEDPIERFISACDAKIDDKIVKDFADNLGGRLEGIKKAVKKADYGLKIGQNKGNIYIEIEDK